jgi:hypothetical protein
MESPRTSSELLLPSSLALNGRTENGWNGAGSEEELSVGGYSQFASPVSITVPEAVTAIQQLGLPPEITSKAIDTFYRLQSDVTKQVHPVKSLRKKRKDRCVFLCVFIAYNDSGMPMDPVAVANLTKLDSGEIDQAFNDNTINIVIDPVKLSRYYVQSINTLLEGSQLNVDLVEQEVRKIIEICRQKKSGQEVLENSPAKHISVGVTCFYILDVGSMNIHRSILERACHLSWACISKYHRQISQLYNA